MTCVLNLCKLAARKGLPFIHTAKNLLTHRSVPVCHPVLFGSRATLQALAFAVFWLTGVRLECSRKTEVETFLLFALVLDGTNLP